MNNDPKDFRFRTHYLGDFATEPKINNAKKYADAVERLADLQEKDKAGKRLGSVQQKDLAELPAQIEILKDLKDIPTLSQTAQKRVNKCKREWKYGITENLGNKYVTKGLMCEEDAISLNSKLEGVMMLKNKTKLSNNLIAGEWDIDWNSKKLGKVIDDTKVSYNAQSFDDTTTVKKAYYWQGTGYMWLTGADYARIVHLLVNTPEILILKECNDEIYPHYIKYINTLKSSEKISIEEYHLLDESIKRRTQIFRNHIFTDEGWIYHLDGSSEYLKSGYWDYLVNSHFLDTSFKFVPIKDNQRRKIFQFKRNEEDIKYIEQKLITAREYFIRSLDDDSEMIYDLTKDDFEN